MSFSGSCTKKWVLVNRENYIITVTWTTAKLVCSRKHLMWMKSAPFWSDYHWLYRHVDIERVTFHCPSSSTWCLLSQSSVGHTRVILCDTGITHMPRSHAKAYCIVAMETNLSASLSLSVLRFTLEFVLVQSVHQLIQLTGLRKPTSWPHFCSCKNFLFNQSPLVLQIKSIFSEEVWFDELFTFQSLSILTAGVIKLYICQWSLRSTWLTGSTV